jgi:hypothetical protein
MQLDSESPFSDSRTSFALYLEPVLNQYYQTYQNVITVNHCPSGPIADMIIPISTVKLSPFQENGQFSEPRYDSCMFILCRYRKTSPLASIKNTKYFMTAEDIPSVLSYLIDNGYKINTDVTKLLFKSGLVDSQKNYRGKRKMICLASYIT